MNITNSSEKFTVKKRERNGTVTGGYGEVIHICIQIHICLYLLSNKSEIAAF